MVIGFQRYEGTSYSRSAAYGFGSIATQSSPPPHLPAFVASAVLTRAGPRVFERVPLRDELSGAHGDPRTRSAIKRRLGLRLGRLMVHGVKGIRVLHDASKGTNATPLSAGEPAEPGARGSAYPGLS
jgi:hypothetical protein